MTEQKTALMGFHHVIDAGVYKKGFERNGYKVEQTNTIEIMLRKAREKEYDWYLMDANLGIPMSDDISPSKQVYELVRPRIEDGNARFLALSHAKDVVEKAQKEGIPAMLKLRFTSKLDELLGD